MKGAAPLHPEPPAAAHPHPGSEPRKNTIVPPGLPLLFFASALVLSSSVPTIIKVFARVAKALLGTYGNRIQICDGVADDVEIAAAQAAAGAGKIVCIGQTFNTTTAITIVTNNQCIEFQAGSTLDYTGADAAVILQGDYVELIFDQMKSTGATANYGIKDQGARWARVKGNNIGTTAIASTDRFVVAPIFFDAANAVNAASGGSLYDIGFINHGQYGVKLDSFAATTYEGSKFLIRVIMRATVEALRIGSDVALDTVMFNSFFCDLDSQGITPLLARFYNDKNFLLLEHFNNGTGAADITFDTGAVQNTVISGAGTSMLRFVDVNAANAVQRVLSSTEYGLPGLIPTVMGTLNVKDANDPTGTVRGSINGSTQAMNLLERPTHIADGDVPEDYGCWYIYNDGAGTTQLVVKLKVGGVVKTGTLNLA